MIFAIISAIALIIVLSVEVWGVSKILSWVWGQK